MLIALLLGLSLGSMFGLHYGRRMERRKLWDRMTGDRAFGQEVLEQLASHHRAKVEITDV